MKLTLVILLISIGGFVHAQSLYNNQSIIAISPSAVLYVKDTIVNNGTIINNGDMQVGGSWINNAQYDAGQGQITFNSDLPQIINHNDQSFSKLTISGGGQKLFLANITIEDQLDLSAGTLVSENDATIIFSPAAQITGGSDNAHIQGAVYHQGTGNKLFPLGNGTVYLPVELLNVQGSTADVGLRLIEPVGVTLPVSPSLTAVSTNRYWEIDLVSGSLDNALVTLPVRDEAIVTTADGVVVAQSPGLTQGFESLGNSDFQGVYPDGKVTSKNFVSQPYIAVGTSNSAIIVYNAVSPNGDDLNDYLRIGNIERYPENKFSLFNRWGDKIFEIDNYDNKDRVFRGKSNVNGEKDLGNGTYFYVIETKEGLKVNGFLSLKN
jgi:gliding motility-associated-like protein